MPTAESGRGLSLFDAARAMGVQFPEEVEPADRFVQVNGMSFHYLDWGTEGKSPILFLHGMAQQSHSWDFVALALRTHLHVRALDQRGHGDTDWPPDGDYGFEAFQCDLEGAVDALGLDRFILVGHSMGGRNAIIFTANHPQRVQALVIVDTGPQPRRQGASTIRRFMAGPDELEFEEFVHRVRRFNPLRPVEQIRGSLRHNLRQLPSGKWTWKYDRRLRDHQRPVSRGDLDQWPYIEKIHCPTLLIRGGESDVLAPEAAERVVQTIPGSRLVTVPRAGHIVAGDNPADFIRAVREFLADMVPE